MSSALCLVRGAFPCQELPVPRTLIWWLAAAVLALVLLILVAEHVAFHVH